MANTKRKAPKIPLAKGSKLNGKDRVIREKTDNPRERNLDLLVKRGSGFHASSNKKAEKNKYVCRGKVE